MTDGGAGGFDLEALLRPVRAQREDPTGQVLSGCRLERLLGRGGMGAAWLARREADGRAVVVKLLDPVDLAQPDRRARARREWSTLGKVRPSPHVVAVLGLDLEHARPHLVLEHVPGEGLDALAARGPLPWAEAARAAADLARGLAAIHEQGVVHRDVKPANALRRPDGTVTLVDFGLAKDLFTTSVTQADTLLGTAPYMAPEQWADATVRDGRCDLFSLGATLYELAAGRTPFEADDPQGIADAASAADYVPLEEAAPGAPPELGLVVDLLLEPDPAWRYPRADLVARDLDAVLAGRPSSAPRLEDARGGRWPLVRGRRWTLGSGPGCQVTLPPPVSPRHAQLRREARGFALVDVQGSAGTRVGGAPVQGAPRALAHGDVLDLAGVALRLVDPLRAALADAGAGGAGVVDVARARAPAPVVQALAAEGDPRAAAWLVERLAPERWLREGAERALGAQPLALAGGAPALAAQVGQALAAEEARAAPWARDLLGRLVARQPGVAPPASDDLPGWLAWWVRARGAFPEQVGPAEPDAPQRLALAPTGAGPGGPAADHPLDGRGVVLVGRDPRCALVLPVGPSLAVTLTRLHRRWIGRDEASGAAGWVEPGVAWPLGPVALTLEAPPWPPARPGAWLAPAALWALAQAGHPAAAPGLLAVLGLGPAVEAALAGLGAGDAGGAIAARARALLADRVRFARERLVALTGRDPGAQVAPGAWRALAGQGPAFVAAGWVADG